MVDINSMKFVNQLKKVLKCCTEPAGCTRCPYNGKRDCSIKKDQEVRIVIDKLLLRNAYLRERLEVVTLERDAAVSDLYRARHCLTCAVNRDSKDETAPEFRLLCHPCKYAWRGPCEENRGVEDEKNGDENR